MKKIILNIGGMSCAACASRIEKYLNKQEGVIEASVNLVMAQAFITYEDKLNVLDLERFIKEAGYSSLGIYNPKQEKKEAHKGYILIVFGLLAVFTLYIAMGPMINLPEIPLFSMAIKPYNYAILLGVLATSFILFGLDIMIKGIKNLISLSPNMDTLVSLGVLASYLYSIYHTILLFMGNDMMVHELYFESCALIIFFIKLGRFIDFHSKEKTKSALKELVTITPSKALLEKDGELVEVEIGSIKPHDILVCKTGMKIAVDGTVTKGNAYVDESFITGESKPVKKSVGDKVLAGSITMDGVISYEAINIGPDSVISSIVKLVVEATGSKPHIAKVADKISGYFVPGIIIIALLTLISYLVLGRDVSFAINRFVSVLVIACPCALGLATPLAVVVSEGASAKKGILIKNSTVLESVKDIDTVIFDKTGTLTYGKLKLAKMHNYSKLDEKELLSYVGSVEALSSHPLALSLNEVIKEKGISLLEVKDFKEMPGIGVKGKVLNKEIYLGNEKVLDKLKIKNTISKDTKELANAGASLIYGVIDKKIVCLLGMQDIVRENSKKTVSELKKMHKEVIMLTGDNAVTAKKIASVLGIDNVIAEVTPEVKNKVVKEKQDKGYKVMMVGDGINDAISLTAAHVGVSLNSGTDIAGDSAEVILIHNDLYDITTLFKISNKTMKIIKENLFWAFLYNMLMVPIAIGLVKGITISPALASLAMMVSSLTVVLNSLRLRKVK